MNKQELYQNGFYALAGFIIGFICAALVFYKPISANTEIKLHTQPIEKVITSDSTNVALNDANLFKELVRQNVHHPEIVLAQAKLETGNYRSDVCRKKNNLFGLRHKDGYYEFDDWRSSVVAYRDYVQYKYRKGEDYMAFLKRIGYAEDPDYIKHVRSMML